MLSPMNTRRLTLHPLTLGACATALAISAIARAQSAARLDLAPTIVAQPAPANQAQLPDLTTQARLAFTKEGSHWGVFGGGITQAFYGNATGFNATFSYSYFLIDNVEVAGEIGGWFYNQRGANAVGLNPAAILRWHFWRSDDLKTTVYFDAGIGFALFSNQVPYNGTSFDFTPRFGFGLTQQINDEGWRLQAGLRWNHVSNARILGDAQNPSRDGPLLYFGLIVPF
jgi:hypothetical protein